MPKNSLHSKILYTPLISNFLTFLTFDFQDGQVVIFGGVEDVKSNKRTNQVQTCYIQVPSLRHLSWRVLNNNFDLFTKIPENLKEEGVPQDLIGQLVN